MKKSTLVVFVLCTIYAGAFSQLQHEHTYDESANIVQLEGLGEVYYAMDLNNYSCHIYRMDHSLMKTISLPTPGSYYLVDIQHVSQYLFNDDEKIELAYIYSKYVPTELSYYTVYETRVINEDGAVLLTLSGVGFTQVIETSAGKKFLAYEYDYSADPWQTRTLVYALPDHSQTRAVFRENDRSLPAWPNPADQVVNITIESAEKGQPGTLILTDMSGRSVMELAVSPSAKQIGVPVSHLPDGTYQYRIRTVDGQSSAKKLIVRH